MPPERPIATLKALRASARAWSTAAVAVSEVPVAVPGGNPIIVEPVVPISPLMMVGPVLVIPEL